MPTEAIKYNKVQETMLKKEDKEVKCEESG